MFQSDLCIAGREVDVLVKRKPIIDILVWRCFWAKPWFHPRFHFLDFRGG